MVIKTVNLALVCGVTSKIPAGSLPEFAFAGRSNAGKSTLINGLMNRKSLARVSAQPGKTRTINYYEVNGAFHLVDLPGYGYAKANVKVKEQWGQMIERYLHTTRQLRAIFLLLDIRHEPTGQDVQMFDWILQAGYTPVIIATKADKIKRSQLSKQLALLRKTLREKSLVFGAGAALLPGQAIGPAPAERGAAQQALDAGQNATDGVQQALDAAAPPSETQEAPDAAGTGAAEGGGSPQAKKEGRQIRIIPWSGLTKAGREEIYEVLDGLLEQSAQQ